MPSRRDLTARQLAFANAILDGKGPSEAYRLAGYKNGNPTVIPVKAQEVLKSEAVAAYIAKGQAQLEQKGIVDRERALQILTVIAEGTGPSREKIAAIVQISKMLGYDAPQKVAVHLEGSLLWQIRNSKTHSEQSNINALR